MKTLWADWNRTAKEERVPAKKAAELQETTQKKFSLKRQRFVKRGKDEPNDSDGGSGGDDVGGGEGYSGRQVETGKDVEVFGRQSSEVSDNLGRKKTRSTQDCKREKNKKKGNVQQRQQTEGSFRIR